MIDDKEIMKKYSYLIKSLKEKKKIAIAFSGGLDSSFVAYVAKQAGIDILLLTVTSPLFSKHDEKLTKKFAEMINVPQVILSSSLDEEVIRNDLMRCFHCKNGEAKIWISAAKEHGFSLVADGINYDDIHDKRRPGVFASCKKGIWHPLVEMKITKKEIRVLAKKFGLPQWNQPSNACLASRIAFGEEITKEKLFRIENAEAFLRTLSPQVRIRLHNTIARIEVPVEYIPIILSKRKEIVEYMKKLNFTYITLDLLGYRSGSMHEEISGSSHVSW